MRIACVGSRDIDYIRAGKLFDIGKFLVERGHTIVTGNAEGADYAFASGGNSVNAAKVELHLPWPTFRIEHVCNSYSSLPANKVIPKPNAVCHEAAEAAWHVIRGYGYTDWKHLSYSTRDLMARNYGIINSSDTVIAAPRLDGNGNPTGGTAFAIGVAKELGKPVQLIDLSKGDDPNWDRCRACGCGRTVWDCGSGYHALKAYC